MQWISQTSLVNLRIIDKMRNGVLGYISTLCIFIFRSLLCQNSLYFQSPSQKLEVNKQLLLYNNQQTMLGFLQTSGCQWNEHIYCTYHVY